MQLPSTSWLHPLQKDISKFNRKELQCREHQHPGKALVGQAVTWFLSLLPTFQRLELSCMPIFNK